MKKGVGCWHMRKIPTQLGAFRCQDFRQLTQLACAVRRGFIMIDKGCATAANADIEFDLFDAPIKGGIQADNRIFIFREAAEAMRNQM